MQNQLNRLVREHYIQPTERILRNIQEATLEEERENRTHAVAKSHVDAQIRQIAQRRFECAASWQ